MIYINITLLKHCLVFEVRIYLILIIDASSEGADSNQLESLDEFQQYLKLKGKYLTKK